jgi:hypothetical protein
MLWTLFVILLILWGLGLLTGYTLGGVIHVLLVIAIVVVLIQVIQGRRRALPFGTLPDKGLCLAKGINTMKKSNRFIAYLVLLMFIASFVACASTSKQEGTGEYVDDSVITTKVKSQLAADDFLKSFEISVETYKGIVQLSGFVDSQLAVNKAGEIARGVQGVKSVQNDLNVKK